MFLLNFIFKPLFVCLKTKIQVKTPYSKKDCTKMILFQFINNLLQLNIKHNYYSFKQVTLLTNINRKDRLFNYFHKLLSVELVAKLNDNFPIV